MNVEIRDMWEQYENVVTDDRTVLIYKHTTFDVWVVVEEQWEGYERTHFATFFVDRDEYDENVTEIDQDVLHVVSTIAKNKRWRIEKVRPVVGDVTSVYAFADID